MIFLSFSLISFFFSSTSVALPSPFGEDVTPLILSIADPGRLLTMAEE